MFRPFLENRENSVNELYLYETPLDYYQENLWLFQYESALNLTDKIKHAQMVDGIDLWEADVNRFNMTIDNSTTSNNTNI